jgi:hypothetical protein
VIGENLKALEVAEEKAQQREEEYKKQVLTLTFCNTIIRKLYPKILKQATMSFQQFAGTIFNGPTSEKTGSNLRLATSFQF